MTRFDADVAIIGVGAMGSATLWRLAERGVSCLGFERFEPGHDRGSSHGDTRIFRTAYLEGPEYVPLAQRAIPLWSELQQVSGVPLMTPNGALTLGDRDGASILGTLKSIHCHNLDHQVWDAATIRSRYPAHRVEDNEVGIYEPNAGFLRPEISILAAVQRAEALGARVQRNVTIDRIEHLVDGVRVSAGSKTYQVQHAVVSVGAWLSQLLPELRLPLRVTRQTLAWFPVEHPEQFLPDRFPVFLRDINENWMPGYEGIADCTFYGFPTLDGKTVKIGIHREGETTSPDELDRTVSPDDLAPIQAYIERFFCGVSTRPEKSMVCMYTNTPDHNFLIGSADGMPNVTILGGFSGHGFKFAPIVGEAAADLATRGETSLPMGWLSPNRFIADRAVLR